ncbi:MAG: membrane protein insertase YidC [Desulfobacterales bacterium]|jgi:YidC/Oxa1 family membrane protein insertase|nr:membrane protein insertase YidC [Desulfobacterales bacterium]
MEQFRMFIAITLSLLVFLAWNYFFSEKRDPVAGGKDSVLQDVAKETRPDSKTATSSVAEKTVMAPAMAVEKQVPAKTISVGSPLYTVEIDTRGAIFKSFRLKQYKETVAADAMDKELISKTNQNGTIHMGLNGNTIPGLQGAVFSVDKTPDQFVVKDQTVSIPFVWVSPEGVIVEKRYTFNPNSYLIGLDITIQNNSEVSFNSRLAVSLENHRPPESSQYGFEGPAAFINGKLQQIETDSIKDKNLYHGDIKWFTLQDRYFMTSIIPKQNGEAGLQLLLKGEETLSIGWIGKEAIIAPHDVKNASFDLYLGPNKISILKTFGTGLEKAIDFGWFDFIARPCLWIMNKIYTIIPNYGFAIIILTILIKIILWPLGQKSYSSMNQMKRMQPLMAEIREKYKDDKKRINEEMMRLYKTYKVNPMGGCLPMIAQIPVFFAFYRMLYEAVELRHAPFLGWINDLSAPDRLFHFNITIPFMEPPYGIPVLTIIMGATMFIQQKMQPPMGDPAQAKMMMFMPIIFTVIFINFSSGLVLYWLVNNILSIAQQYVVSKKNA